MRTSIVIGILLTFCLAEIRSVLPLLEYALQYEYISEVLCVNKDDTLSHCQGMCYVSDQLRKAQESENEGQKIPEVELDRIPMISSVDKLPTVVTYSTLQKSLTSRYSFSVKDLTITPPSPPPEC